jgi:type I restriction enzyme, S subunit
MNKLPGKWVWTTLENVAEWGSGGTPSKTQLEYYGGEIPWIKTGELGQGIITRTEEKITPLGLQNSSAKLFPKDSVAIAMYGATIGKVGILGIEAATNQACAVGVPIDGLTTTKYLFHFLASQKEKFVEAGKGGAQPNISQGAIKKWAFPLPPINEQKRIAEKLEQLLERVDSSKARLKIVLDMLKRFRQSALSAAMSGKLTEDWRKENGISSEWAESELSESTEKITDGEHITPKRSSAGKFLLSARNVRDGYIALEDVDFVDEMEFSRIRKRCDPNIGDVLLSCSGSVGRAALVDKDNQYVMVRSAAMIRPKKSVLNSQFLMYALQSPILQIQIAEKSSSTAQANIFLGSIKSLVTPLPPIPEQLEIVRRVEKLFAFADQLEQHIQTAYTTLERLTPSIHSGESISWRTCTARPNRRTRQCLTRANTSGSSARGCYAKATQTASG